MAEIKPICALMYVEQEQGDISNLIAPPYDVLDEVSKGRLLQRNERNIVAVDLPHLPPKTVGPDATYEDAGRQLRRWIEDGVMRTAHHPLLYAYRQTFEARGQTYRRCGLIANVPIQPLHAAGVGKPMAGAIHPHEQTFSAPKEDRLKLMHATRAQLSPVFGMFRDESGGVGRILAEAIATGPALMRGTTEHDGVLHELWPCGDAEAAIAVFGDRDIYIADGHHRYTTAVRYMEDLSAVSGTDAAGCCMFVLVPMEDPGMIVLPTHRVLGGMAGFSPGRLTSAAAGRLTIRGFDGGDLEALEAALPEAGLHAMGFYFGPASAPTMALATPLSPDPLAETHADRSDAWRHLDVAIVQHLLVERICEPTFTPGGHVNWSFPHTLDELAALTDASNDRLGVVCQATPLDAVRQVSDAGELMPPKSTFFYPKLATGMVLNPLE